MIKDHGSQLQAQVFKTEKTSERDIHATVMST